MSVLIQNSKENEINNGGVWVFAEQLEGQFASVTLELLGSAKKLASQLNVQVGAVLIGEKVEPLVSTLYRHGADSVYLVDSAVFHHYRTETYTSAFCHLVNKYHPEIVLMGATTTGRDLAGAVATSLQTGLTADCTALDIDMEKRILLASRPAFGGNIMATIVCEDRRPQMATVRPRVMPAGISQMNGTGKLIRESLQIEEETLRTKVLEIVTEQVEQVKLEDAAIIVSGGRGIQNEHGVALLHQLAKVLGGVVGGSRGAVEKGLIDPKRQIGQTGTTVAPRLYFAIGISGAIQHIVGLQGSDTIIAINTDPDCPIMKLATYSIVGDAFEIVPKLIEGFIKVFTDSPITGVQNAEGGEFIV
ncbi:electron transfer flavoprotein subunit alpha/FixB family protein [Clostridium aminobutyricum]|uniref:electron transfer flavoprotein subunit alpha/FixB family protein n=1 Tax=Clostridium aminobutyricum TaxID=33953 RepID=UPI0031454039